MMQTLISIKFTILYDSSLSLVVAVVEAMQPPLDRIEIARISATPAIAAATAARVHIIWHLPARRSDAGSNDSTSDGGNADPLGCPIPMSTASCITRVFFNCIFSSDYGLGLKSPRKPCMFPPPLPAILFYVLRASESLRALRL